jgi:hypothetical protein
VDIARNSQIPLSGKPILHQGIYVELRGFELLTP